MRFEIAQNPDIPLYRRIGDAIREAVVSGRLSPGEKLPAKAVLAQELGVGKLTVSNSYDLLSRSGIVVQKQGSGTYVLPDALEKIRNSTGRRYDTIAVVIGESKLADCMRETVFIVTDILEGFNEVMGHSAGRILFVESLNSALLDKLTDQSAVLLKRARETDPAVLETLSHRGIPVLGIWGHGLEVTVPRVDYDHHQAAALACEHLIDCGYKHIGFIGAMDAEHPLGVKFFEFTNVLYKAGLDYQIRHVGKLQFRPGEAYGAAQRMLNAGDMPEAIFVDSAYHALEVITALNDAGLKVPQDIGIVSQDDIPEAVYFKPGLTTVSTPRREIGRQAAQLLLNWSADKPPQSITLTSELVIRHSTAAAGKDNLVAR